MRGVPTTPQHFNFILKLEGLESDTYIHLQQGQKQRKRGVGRAEQQITCILRGVQCAENVLSTVGVFPVTFGYVFY